MAAGSIVISLLMLTGSFETDTKKAERALNRLKKEAAETGKVVGTALAAGAVAAAYAFDKLVKGAADFKDLEETTGASAEELASLAIAAETAGVGMETLAANSIRLTKGLTGVDDESKAAGAAIAALGLNLADFKKLDPVAQVDALTKAFAGFKDGSEKTAVATALWGKSGAEMLKVMKALEEQGGRSAILTQTQIDQADAYADAQAKAGAELRLYAQAAATQGAPAFLALTNAAADFIKELIGVDKETGRLAQSSAMKDFATGAVKALAFVIDAGDGVVRVFKGVGLAVGAAAAVVGAFVSGDDGLKRSRAIIAELGADLDALASKSFFSDGLNARLAAGGPAAAGPDTRPRLNFAGAAGRGSGARAAKQEIDEVAKAIKALDEELALFGKGEAFARAFKLEGLGATTVRLEEYRRKLAQLEELKTAAAIEETINALVRERDEIGLTNEQLTIQKLLLRGASAEKLRYAQSVLDASRAAREQQAAVEEGKRLYEQTRTPIELLNIEMGRLNDLLQRGVIDWDTYSRKVFQAQDRFDESNKKVEKQADSFTKKFAENVQDTLGQGLYDAMTGNFKNIGDAFAQMITRMVAEAAAAELARHLFGDLVKGGEGGGLFGSLVSGIGSFFGGSFAGGGSPPVGKMSLVGERGPELFVPRTAGTIVPAGPTGRMLGGNTINFGGIAVHSNGAMDRAAEERAALRIARKASGLINRRTA